LKENFDRFNFAIHKEKEMVSFRRLILAIAVLALFTGLASAQVVGVGGSGTLACTASVAAPPQLRAEGMTENIGDIVLVCTGGVQLPLNAAVPTANITVSLGTNVTSRLLGANTTSSPSNASEALLLLDEPGSGLLGSIGSQVLCSNSALGSSSGGCVETANGTGGWAGTPASVFQGLVSGNQVTFNGIPINPPGSAGSRVYRITNVRANASGLGGGGLSGTTPLLASVSITGGSTSLPISNAVPTAGFIQAGLAASVRSATAPSGSGSGNTFNQCSSATLSASAIVRFAENFAAAFKTRTAVPGFNGQTATTSQNIPGNIYASESNFTYNVGATNTAGLADYGTRLKAVFNNIPSGVSIFVTTTNFPANGNVSSATQSTNPPTATVLPATNSLAGLVSSETLADSNNLAPLVAGTTSVNSSTTNLVQLPIVNNSAVAIWEVLNTNPNLSENFDFGVYITYSANVASNSPPPGSGTVNLSFAPTPTQGAFSASSGAAASSSLPIPRFADVSTATNFVTVVICQTSLLFPFVTNINGFDTGIAIANTTTDPFGTKAQAGPCNMSFYGSGAPSAVSTGNIATGTVYTTTAGASAPNFQGYMIAVCNFQLAHGFAFVSDVGARNLAMGYLALILPGGTGSRPSSSGTATFNENFGIVH